MQIVEHGHDYIFCRRGSHMILYELYKDSFTMFSLLRVHISFAMCPDYEPAQLLNFLREKGCEAAMRPHPDCVVETTALAAIPAPFIGKYTLTTSTALILIILTVPYHSSVYLRILIDQFCFSPNPTLTLTLRPSTATTTYLLPAFLPPLLLLQPLLSHFQSVLLH